MSARSDAVRRELIKEQGKVFMKVAKVRIAPKFIALIVLSELVSAQGFPTRPIRIIATATVGGGVDTSSRIVAQNMPELLGQPAIVENRPGGGGAAGSDFVAKSVPDGHTLLTISISHAVLPSSHKNLPYSPERDLIPVSVMVNSPNILVSHPSLPVKSIKELIAYARKRPGEINYASSGNASPSHLATEHLKLLAQIDLTHVAFKGTVPGLTDTLAGRVSLMFTSILSAQQLIDAGRLKVLATAGSKRAAGAPGIPTIAEAGVPGYAVDVWYAMLAPAATPRPVLERSQPGGRKNPARAGRREEVSFTRAGTRGGQSGRDRCVHQIRD
jgi:tripartite-type tricarboxylate transporter receptor subunit TctC